MFIVPSQNDNHTDELSNLFSLLEQRSYKLLYQKVKVLVDRHY
jgi:hypothetical protein